MPPSMSAPARGIVSQPSMSASLMIADTRPVGSMIWTEHGQKIWGLAKVVSQANTILIVRRETGEEAEIDLGFGETYPHNPKVVADMTALHHIHEAGILHNLGKRAKDQKPYTFMGTILIAVNPLRPIPDPSADEYVDRPLNPETPHPYAIAELSYYQMRLGAGRTGSNQSIVVSGESGAGKTESSKVILRYLTRRSKGGVTGLEQKVVDSSPILESFGNAKTLRNNNSSRFGKFLKMQFTQDKYRLAGAFIETYLLEKSRVLSQGQGERNFHILYELVAGAKKCGLAAELQLEGPEAYHVLSDSGCTTLEGVDDAAQFEAVRKACGTIGMDEATQNQVWKMLAAVLHMSNVAFDAKDDAEGEVAAVRDAAALERLSALMGVEAALLEAMLTRRVVKTGREEFTKKLGVQDAALSRDAVVKALFQALFLWIVRVINESLGKGAESLPFIGVLDIFGFENFEHSNEFEQLLINFTNENLQDTFNKQVFENELQLYQSEGIEVEVSSCPDNAECLAMLSAATTGVIPRLNNVCRELNACDDRFLATLHKEFKGHQHFPSTSQRDMRQCFWVKHYAGSVKYTVKGWVARNMDNVPQTFAPSLKSSKFKVVREMADVNGAEGTQKRKNTLMKPTVAKAFLESMKGLNATLLNTKCNFVRCIKPNAQMECGVYDNKYVVEQLQCLGILQTCEVLKVGMPTRVTYTDLKEVLGSEAAEADKLFKGEPETALIAAILWAFEVPSEAFRLGRTRVFFRAGQISTLQKILNETTADDARRISDRLREALEKRHAAKAAAEEAQAAMSKAERGVKEAETAAESVLGKSAKGEGEDDQLQLILSRTFSAASPSAVSEDELHDLESTAKMARTAGSTARKIGLMIEAAELDDVGKYAKGAMDRLLAGSREALASIEDAASRAVRLEAEVKEVRGTDEAAALRELAGMLKSLRCEVKVGKQLTEATMEAAAKCQVEKTRELTEKAKTKASSVEVQARAVAGVAKGAAKASERQQAALGKAKASAQGVASAGEKARLAFSSFRELLETITGEEERAKVAKIAADELDRSVKAEKAAAAAATAAAAAAEAAASAAQTAPLATERGTPTSDGGKDASSAISPSPAPVDRRSSGIKMGRSSVRDMLSSEMAKSPVVSPSPRARPKPDVYQPDIKIEVEKGPKHGRRPKLQRGATQRFNEAMSESFVQGHLITPYGMLDRPARRFFVLSDGFLTHYEKKSLVNTNKHKRMKLTSSSVTVRANRPNTFGVVTKNANGRGQTTWMLMAQHKAQMEGWMTAINDQINALFVRENNVSDDDYENQGKCGQFFYEMLAGAKPQYIRLFPMANAPRTGGGLFEREIIEVTQVLKVDDVEFLRMAGDRGWACSRDVEGGGGQVFTEFRGELVKDTHVYTVPMVGGQLAVVVYGPHMEAQPTGDSIAAGKNVRAVQRFTSAPKSDGQTTTFIKLGGSYHGGWVVLTQGKGMVGLVPARR